MIVTADQLRDLVRHVFAAAGCPADEALYVARYLVEANLVGHDSHGVIRVPSYVEWLRTGKVLAGQTIDVVFENDAVAVVDGKFGLGQTVGEQAVRLGIDKSAKHGVAVVALRNSGHLGRIGDWPLLAARAGRLSLHFVNTSGAGILVAPFGGINRRLSANPIAFGAPEARYGPPILLDMSACTIAEGKVRVALNKGVPVPDGCLIDARGQPTNDPKVFYGDPPGSILSIAGHKGYGLAVMCELLAGALTGGGCSNPANAGRVVNGMLSVYLDGTFFGSDDAFFAEVEQFIGWVKSAEAEPGREILMPGEVEERTRINRLHDGIELDETTWGQILTTCRALGVDVAATPPNVS